MKDYKSLYRFRSLAIAFLVDCYGVYLVITNQLDPLGKAILFTIALAFKLQAAWDFYFTNNEVEAQSDRELSGMEAALLITLLVLGTVAFLWYALTR